MNTSENSREKGWEKELLRPPVAVRQKSPLPEWELDKREYGPC